MGLEIERKFLLRDGSWPRHGEAIRMIQGYLSRDPERTVRVRIAGQSAWVTIKGRSSGCSRAEFEYEIPRDDAGNLIAMCLPGIIEKTRYRIRVGAHLWEVDEFHGSNQGLVVAEIELANESERFEIPDWVGREVTNDFRYSNSNLTRNPYSGWEGG